MSIKTNGAEFKAFYQDEAWWREGWIEDDIIVVNGEEHTDGVCIETMNDTDNVVIHGGWINGLGKDISLESFFRQWRKAHNTVRFVVECDASKEEAIKAAIKAAGGKIK